MNEFISCESASKVVDTYLEDDIIDFMRVRHFGIEVLYFIKVKTSFFPDFRAWLQLIRVKVFSIRVGNNNNSLFMVSAIGG